ncbi:MAG: beta-lactamase family protein [Actinobacteria bacterium]|nr:beta-lactamase family protein [Actinomycetota bacterium]
MQEGQAMLEKFLAANSEVPGVLLHIDGPRGSWSGAAGVRDHETAEALEPDATFRIASVTKTYTAASVLRLCELGNMSLDDPIGTYLDEELRDLLGDDRCQGILVSHLLSHTSGLCDFVEDTNYVDLVMSDLQRQWTREEQVHLALTGCSDVGAPGETFHYSDTGYVLLGAAIENVMEADLAQSLRSLLHFDDLGLVSTYLESLEPTPPQAKPRACQYLDGRDTCDADPTFDLWGGGGLVATTQDLAGFFRALFEHRVYESINTLDRMIEPAAISDDGAQIGFGIAGRPVPGGILYGHGGYWGVYGGFLPNLDMAFAVAILERSGMDALAEELLPQIIASADG